MILKKRGYLIINPQTRRKRIGKARSLRESSILVL